MNTLVIDSLATYRLSRLITRDRVTRGLRHAVIVEGYEAADRELPRLSTFDPEYEVLDDPQAPALAVLVSCQACMSVWAALFVVAARRWMPRVWDPVARLLALSGAAVIADGI